LRRIAVVIGAVSLLAGCRWPYPPSGRVGTFVWSTEMWADTLDSCVSYIDSVYKGTDKLGPGVKSGVVWLVKGDVSDTACLRFGEDPAVHYFKRDDRVDYQHRRLFFNYDTATGGPIVAPGERYSLCAAIIINGDFLHRWGLKLVMPNPPDSSFLDSIPDEVVVGRAYHISWAPDTLANAYMIRFIGYNDYEYYCYVENIVDTPSVTFVLYDFVPGECVLIDPETGKLRDSLRIDIVNLYRLTYDYGDMFGETRSMGRITKWVRLRPPSSSR